MTASKPLVILKETIIAGESKTINMEIAKLHTMTKLKIPIIVERSKLAGPTVLFTACLHGDEINGTEIVRQLIVQKINTKTWNNYMYPNHQYFWIHQVATAFSDQPYGTWFHGEVVDMFYFPMWEGDLPSWLPIWGGKHFTFFNAIFNIADMAISTGVGILIVFNKRAFASTKKEVLLSED